MGFEELKGRQSVISGTGPYERLPEHYAERREGLHRAFVAFYEGYRTDDGVHQPRPDLLVLGTRR